MAGIVVSSAAYLLAYVIALGAGLVLLVAEDRANAPIVALALVFIVAASALAAVEIALSGRPSQWHGGRAGRRIGRLLELLASARGELSRVIMLSDAGMPVPLALSATLLFRGLTFWLPMLPAAVLERSVRRRI